MQISSNTTPYLAELFGSVSKNGQKHCTVIVKATFDVRPDGECLYAEQQIPLVYHDEHLGDPASTAVRHESDFVPFKPLAEVLLHAQAIAPSRRAVDHIQVSLGWAGHAKHALVFGNRAWRRGILGHSPTAPQPFTEMPLSWDRAFGGVDASAGPRGLPAAELRNMVGCGYRVSDKDLAGVRLPNIERLDARIDSWTSRPPPIGFGPVGRNWHPRLLWAGTYDDHWLKRVRPFLPGDFDERFHQAAPEDQQLQRLSPGAAFACVNMTESGRFVARLPAMVVPVRFHFETGLLGTSAHPDTLILEPDRARLVLVARVRVPLPRKPTALREVHVGKPRPPSSLGKRRYRSLGEAVSELRNRSVERNP